MYPNAYVALEAELFRLRLVEERRAEVRKASYRALRAAGFDLAETSGPRAATNVRLWEEVCREEEEVERRASLDSACL